MSVGITADEVSVVSDSKVLVMFLTLDGGNSSILLHGTGVHMEVATAPATSTP
jgi:hypothetical protein